jgi:dienelactone hydrolase
MAARSQWRAIPLTRCAAHGSAAHGHIICQQIVRACHRDRGIEHKNRTERVVGEHAGTLLEGFARLPAGPGPYPTVLIVHGGLGINHIVPRTAERLAESGYLAVAADMVGPQAQRGGNQAVAKAAAKFADDPVLLRTRAAARVDAVDALRWTSPGRIAVIGYCFGGHCVLELARAGADVKAVVSFHGILTTRAPAEPGSVKPMSRSTPAARIRTSRPNTSTRCVKS